LYSLIIFIKNVCWTALSTAPLGFNTIIKFIIITIKYVIIKPLNAPYNIPPALLNWLRIGNLAIASANRLIERGKNWDSKVITPTALQTTDQFRKKVADKMCSNDYILGSWICKEK
jgi:hypothetical protein